MTELEKYQAFHQRIRRRKAEIPGELEELRQTCDRIAIVSGGRVAGILPASASSEEFGLLMVSQVI